jgi:hypothetical protein
VLQRNLRSCSVKSSKDEAATLLQVYRGCQLSKVIRASVLGSQNASPVTCKEIENIDPNMAFMLYNT